MEIKVLTIKENILDTNTENARRNQSRLIEGDIASSLDAITINEKGAPVVQINTISCKTGKGLEAWLSWLQNEIKQMKKISWQKHRFLT